MSRHDRGKQSLASLICASAVVLAMAGCSGLPLNLAGRKAESKTAHSPSKPASVQVRTGTDGFTLGEVERTALSPQQLADRVAELQRGHHMAAAAHCVQRYPDVTLALLRELGAGQNSADVLQFIARVHDEQCVRGPAGAGWTALLADRGRQPRRYAEYDGKRRQFLTHIQSGHPLDALGLQITAVSPDLPGTMLLIDAQQLTGIALVLADRPKEAVGAFEKALQWAKPICPYQTTSILLLQSDAYRRAGDSAGAETCWREAAQLASELVTGPKAIYDPILWERTAYLRPVNTAWPPESQQRLAEVNVRYGIVEAPRNPVMQVSMTEPAGGEASLWTSVGQWRLSRDEAQGALVALKRAESMTSDPYVAGRLQLAEAKAMVRLGQAQAATAMLINLAQTADPRTSHPAMAALGTLKLQQGGTQQGFNLLRKAVEDDQGVQWHDRAEAEGDLGLAYLLMGEENAGLRWLHSAQQGFEAAGQDEQLIRCLENEAAYLERVKKDDLAKAVRRRLEGLQAG